MKDKVTKEQLTLASRKYARAFSMLALSQVYDYGFDPDIPLEQMLSDQNYLAVETSWKEFEALAEEATN